MSYLWGECPPGNFPGGHILEGNCLGGRGDIYKGGNCPGVIIWGVILLEPNHEGLHLNSRGSKLVANNIFNVAKSLGLSLYTAWT